MRDMARCLHRPEHPGLSTTPALSQGPGHLPPSPPCPESPQHPRHSGLRDGRTSSSATDRRSRRRGACSASTRPRPAAPDCPLRGQATDYRCGPEAVMPATSKLPSLRLHPDATSRDVVGLMPVREESESQPTLGRAPPMRQYRDARRGWPSAADTDELGVALRHELGRDAGADSAVTKVLAARLT